MHKADFYGNADVAQAVYSDKGLTRVFMISPHLLYAQKNDIMGEMSAHPLSEPCQQKERQELSSWPREGPKVHCWIQTSIQTQLQHTDPWICMNCSHWSL